MMEDWSEFGQAEYLAAKQRKGHDVTNEVRIRGGIVRDPVIKNFDNTDLVTFQVAVNGTRYSVTEGKQVVKTAFVTCQAWEVPAVKCMSLKKGDEVYIVGELAQVQKPDRDMPSTRVTVFQVEVLREVRP